MRDKLRKMEVKAMIAGRKVLTPFKNREAIDEGATQGIRGTVGLIITLVIVAIAVILGLMVATNGQTGLTKTRKFFEDLWNAFGGIN